MKDKDQLPTQKTGLSPLTLVELPAQQVQVIRVILRHGAVYYPDLLRIIQHLPEADRLSTAELDEALAHLVQAGYVSQAGTPPDTLYFVYLHPRTHKNLASFKWPTAPGNPLRPNIWSLLGGETPTITPAGRDFRKAPACSLPLKSLLPLLMIMVMNTLVGGLLDVLSTSGFVETLGVKQMPWLWNVNMILVLLSSSGFILVGSRFTRLKMIRLLLMLIVAFLSLMFFLFWLGAPAGLSFILIYIIVAQIDTLFPLTFWGLANELYTMVEARRVFPLLSAGATIGIILGYGLSAVLRLLFPSGEGNPLILLGLGVALNLVSLSSVRWIKPSGANLPETASPGATGLADNSDSSTRPGSLKSNLSLVRTVPIFRYISLAIGLVWLAGTMINYHFYNVLDQATASTQAGFGPLYSFFNIGVILLTLLIQTSLSGRLLARTPIKNALVVFPITMLAALLIAVFIPGLTAVMVSWSLVLVLYDVWDTPARQSVQNLIPDRQRSQVFTFIENYTYALGSLLAGLVLGCLNLFVSLAGVNEMLIRWIYLGLGVSAGAGATWAILKLRASYDDSLLSWRLARPRRKSVLEKIEF